MAAPPYACEHPDRGIPEFWFGYADFTEALGRLAKARGEWERARDHFDEAKGARNYARSLYRK